MKRYLILAPIAVVAAIYALNRGIFVGSINYPMGGDVVLKKCRYLFVTGISEIPARGSHLDRDPSMRGIGLTTNDNLYCHLFGD
jgi:hypothetical protein